MKINKKDFQEPDTFNGFNIMLDYAVVDNQGVGEFQEGVFRNVSSEITWTLRTEEAEVIQQFHYSTDIVEIEIGSEKQNVIFTDVKLNPIFGFPDYRKVIAHMVVVK